MTTRDEEIAAIIRPRHTAAGAHDADLDAQPEN